MASLAVCHISLKESSSLNHAIWSVQISHRVSAFLPTDRVFVRVVLRRLLTRPRQFLIASPIFHLLINLKVVWSQDCCNKELGTVCLFLPTLNCSKCRIPRHIYNGSGCDWFCIRKQPWIQIWGKFRNTSNLFCPYILPSLKLTFSPLEIDGWKWLEYDRFLLGYPIFRGELLVSGGYFPSFLLVTVIGGFPSKPQGISTVQRPRSSYHPPKWGQPIPQFIWGWYPVLPTDEEVVHWIFGYHPKERDDFCWRYFVEQRFYLLGGNKHCGLMKYLRSTIYRILSFNRGNRMKIIFPTTSQRSLRFEKRKQIEWMHVSCVLVCCWAISLKNAVRGWKKSSCNSSPPAFPTVIIPTLWDPKTQSLHAYLVSLEIMKHLQGPLGWSCLLETHLAFWGARSSKISWWMCQISLVSWWK